MPEDLAAAEDIRNAKKGLKGTQKESCHYWRYNNPIHLPLAK
jgi:hypothetical protein